MHYAVHQSTASEMIVERVDSEKVFMGLTNFKGELPTLSEAKIAKNYLKEDELSKLNLLVSGYLDFAEVRAKKEIPMTMNDWIDYTYDILKVNCEDLLPDKGKISRSQMEKKVKAEYIKYKNKTLTQVEKDYLDEIKNINQIAEKGCKDE